MSEIILFGILISTYLLVIAKRVSSLIRSFRHQSAFIFLITLLAGFRQARVDLYFIAALILTLKVFIIPHFLYRTVKRIKVDENLGLFVNPQLSLLVALALTYGSWIFCGNLGLNSGYAGRAITLSLTVVFIGGFLISPNKNVGTFYL